jgi:hypothetical protein
MTSKLAKFEFQQGFHRETTQFAEGDKWFDGNRVRFRAQKPENMRGYTTRVSTAFDGSARDLVTWRDSDRIARAIFGTPDKLYEMDGDQIHDITPITSTVTLAGVFGTSAGSTRVCVSDTGHGRATGDYVYFTSASVFGGNVSLTGNVYPIISIASANVFTIDVTSAAGATSAATGNATFNYYIPTGASVATVGLGYSAAIYNSTPPTSVGISKISTTESNVLVTISCAAAHSGTAGDFVVFRPANTSVVPATVGGNLILSKPFIINGAGTTVSIGGPEFTIVSVASTQLIISSQTAASAASAITADINMTALIYQQSVGRGWNSPSSIDASDINLTLANWSLDNWGEDIVANRKGTNIFYFDSDASTTPLHATTVTTSPISVNSIIVSPNDRHLVALGCNSYVATATISGPFDPMLVRWSDQDNRTNWVPSLSTTAGEVVITDGTEIVGAVRSKNAINIWTDNSLWTMSYAGPPFTFNFEQVGSNCGLVGQHAGLDYNGVTYWMGSDNFYSFSGQVETLNCTVRRYIFENINQDYTEKVFAGINSEFQEIIWLYPSLNSTECDSYVIYSPEEGYWVYGDMIFTTFADREVFGNTITTGVTVGGNLVYDNEPSGVFTANGETLTSFVESGDFDIDDGNALMYMSRLIPDFDLSGGKIKLKLITKQFPESTEKTTKEFDVTETTQKVDLRSRGRQGVVRVSCNSNNASWRWGSIRLAVQGDGGR